MKRIITLAVTAILASVLAFAQDASSQTPAAGSTDNKAAASTSTTKTKKAHTKKAKKSKKSSKSAAAPASTESTPK